nr:MAG TPA: hypothetical protein [Caudoviricetes sp.]
MTESLHLHAFKNLIINDFQNLYNYLYVII